MYKPIDSFSELKSWPKGTKVTFDINFTVYADRRLY